MKKALLFMVAALILLFTASCCAESEPGFIIAPSFFNPVEPDAVSGSTLFYNGDDFGELTSYQDPENGDLGDPYILFNVELDSKYEWVKMRIMNKSIATQFEMHFASTLTEGTSVTADSCTHFPISSNDTEYKEYIFNIKEYNLASQNVNEDVNLTESVWGGTINIIRFDCMWAAEPSGQMPYGSQMLIDYIALFDSEQAAKDYVPAEKVTTAEQAGLTWDKNSPHFIFSDEEEFGMWNAGGAATAYELGNLKLTVNTTDPTLTRRNYDEFNTADYPFFAYRFRTDSTIPVGGIFFTTDTIKTLSDATYSEFRITRRGDWCNIVMDMNSLKHGNWKGTFTGMRLDPVNGGSDIGASILINRMGFFKTKEEALAFLSEGTSEDFSGSYSFTGDNYKVVFPAGTLSEGYNTGDYVLSAGEPSANSVVTYTDAQGNSQLVALSYTNSYGYTSYVARKPGTYTLTTNHKDYTDIAGHWGEQYIDFVSDRTLFGGTSPTEFSPDMTMTRGMFITVLGRMHGLDTSIYDGNTGYTDVPAGEYYAPYIQWAKQYGIMAGTSDTTFAPEQAITRAEMAVAIKNYIDNSGFDFQVYAETEGFNDLAGLDEATVSAINDVKNVGIINGKGEGQFDPNGISTRAEVATVMQRLIKTILGANVASPYSEDYFTRDRIRVGIWGFYNTLTSPQAMKDLADLGIDFMAEASATSANPNLILSCADAYGIEVLMKGYYYGAANPDDERTQNFIDTTDPKIVSASYAEHPSYAGVFITDEPGSDFFVNLGKICDDYESQMPGKRAFVNLLPMYANAAQLKYGASAASIEYYDSDPDRFRKYCQAWCDTNDCDYICTDIYPLQIVGQTKTCYKDYIESINQIATVARENGRKFWCFIQSYAHGSSVRAPSEAEYRWQSYCLLSFGATGILLWQYQSHVNTSVALVDSNGNKTDLYYECQPVMWELRNLSDTYMQYQNLGAFTHNATKSYQKMSGEYKDFDTIKSIDSSNALLIGCFDKKEGDGTAFTVVNMEDFQENLSASCKINLDPSKNVTVYYHGEVSDIKPVNGVLSLDLDCGDAVFVTVD